MKNWTRQPVWTKLSRELVNEKLDFFTRMCYSTGVCSSWTKKCPHELSKTNGAANSSMSEARNRPNGHAWHSRSGHDEDKRRCHCGVRCRMRSSYQKLRKSARVASLNLVLVGCSQSPLVIDCNDHAALLLKPYTVSKTAPDLVHYLDGGQYQIDCVYGARQHLKQNP